MVNELLDLARIDARAGKDFKIEYLPIVPIVNEVAAALINPNDPRPAVIALADDLPAAAIDVDMSGE